MHSTLALIFAFPIYQFVAFGNYYIRPNGPNFVSSESSSFLYHAATAPLLLQQFLFWYKSSSFFLLLQICDMLLLWICDLNPRRCLGFLARLSAALEGDVAIRFASLFFHSFPSNVIHIRKKSSTNLYWAELGLEEHRANHLAASPEECTLHDFMTCNTSATRKAFNQEHLTRNPWMEGVPENVTNSLAAAAAGQTNPYTAT